MKKVKYLGGLGEEIEVNFPGPIVVRFVLGQEVMLPADHAKQLIDCPDYFVEVKAPAKKAVAQGEDN